MRLNALIPAALPSLALALALAHSAPAQSSALRQPDAKRATDTSNKDLPTRLREIDELGRWGAPGVVSDIRVALRDQEPKIRAATMRAIMRMGVDGARDDLLSMVRGKFPDTGVSGTGFVTDEAAPEPQDVAWAARALGRSRQPQAVVPDLINALKYVQPGVRAAALASLQRLTGLSQGASREFLLPMDKPNNIDDLSNRWQTWWKDNSAFAPDQWRLSGLSSTIPKDRASAARALATAGQGDAIPRLIAALRQEGDPANAAGASGVRESMARALNNLTGLGVDYQAYAADPAKRDEWLKQHLAACDRFQQFHDDVVTKKLAPLVALLDAPESKSRLNGLVKLRGRPYTEQPLKKYAELLNDPAKGVAEHALKNLWQATGVSWPFDPTADAELRTIQAARWRDWVAEFDGKRGEGIASVFMHLDRFTWGRGAAASEPARQRDNLQIYKDLAGIRSRAAEWIAIEMGRVRRDAEAASLLPPPVTPTAKPDPLLIAPRPLLDAFEGQLAALRTIASETDVADSGAASMLQRNLARAFGEMGTQEAVRPLIDRIRLSQSARINQKLSRDARVAMDEPETLAACVAALGRLAPEAHSAEPLLLAMLTPQDEASANVRTQAVYALAALGVKEAYRGMQDMLRGDPHIRCRWAAGEALAMMAEKDPPMRADIASALETVAETLKSKSGAKSDVVVTDSAGLYQRLTGLAAQVRAMK